MSQLSEAMKSDRVGDPRPSPVLSLVLPRRLLRIDRSPRAYLFEQQTALSGLGQGKCQFGPEMATSSIRVDGGRSVQSTRVLAVGPGVRHSTTAEGERDELRCLRRHP